MQSLLLTFSITHIHFETILYHLTTTNDLEFNISLLNHHQTPKHTNIIKLVFISQNDQQKLTSLLTSLNLNNKMNVLAKTPQHHQEWSLISSLYRNWQQYKVPPLFYHYTLSILSQKYKQQQIAIMSKEIKLMHIGKHPYQEISHLIAAREQSLQIITKNVDVLKNTNDEQVEQSHLMHHQYHRQYYVVYQSRAKNRFGSRRFVELINHIRIFRKVTIEVVFGIYEWMKDIRQNDYKGIIQFLYENQDYIQKIYKDTWEIVTQNEAMFQKNPFFIIKKEHEKTQYALVYQALKIDEQETLKIRQVLQLIRVHIQMLQKKRKEGIFKQSGSRKSLKAVNKFQRIYCNFNKNSMFVTNYKTTSKGKEVKADHFLLNPENHKELTKSSFFFRKPKKIDSKPLKLERSKSQTVITQVLTQERQSRLSNSRQQDHLKGQFTISLQFENDVPKERIYSYLKYSIFKEKGSEQIQVLAKLLIKYKDYVSIIKIKSEDLLFAWMAVVFNPKDQLFRRVAEILYMQKFMKVPNLYSEIIERFVSKGYGLIKDNGGVIYEQKLNPNKLFSLINIDWRINSNKKDQLKSILKDYQNLKSCRLLKYYTYSQHTKYHKYCQHRQNNCKISFQCDFANKINIEGKTYFKVRCQKIEKIGPLWKIEHKLNQLHLLVAQKEQHILQYEKNHGKSFEFNGQGTDSSEFKQFACFPEVKSLKKYVNAGQQQIIVERLSINQQIFEVLSICNDKKSMKNCLVIDEQSFLAFVCSNQEDYGKTVAIVQLK